MIRELHYKKTMLSKKKWDAQAELGFFILFGVQHNSLKGNIGG